MSRRGIEVCVVWCCAVSLCCSALSAVGCGTSHEAPLDLDGSIAILDGSVGEDAEVPPAPDAGPPGDRDAAVDAEMDSGADPDAGSMDPADAGSMDLDAGPMDPVDAGPMDPVTDPRFEVEMTFTTANIGRTYDSRSEVAAVFDHVADVIGPRSGPRFIGWQEIGEGDPCGTCEIEELRDRFRTESGWETRRPSGTRPDGGSERVKVPITSKGANDTIAVRAVFASPGWAGVSPTRFVTVAHYAQRNVSVLNTHLIAGAWSCGSDVARRRDYWRRAWNTLRDQVAIEHDRGRNVIVTGDLNRPRSANGCNPAWEPTSLHPRARVIGGAGIDYVFAVPAAGWELALSRRSDGTVRRGSIRLGIDGHQAHWVAGRFRAR